MKQTTWFWTKAFILAFGIVMMVRTFAFISCTIPFTGMENTLFQGDRVIVDRWSYGYRTPLNSLFGYHRWGSREAAHDQIAVFNTPAPHHNSQAIDRRDVFICRCAGLPGDTLMLDNQLNLTQQAIQSPDFKSLYTYPSQAEDLLLNTMQQLGICPNELIGYQDSSYIRSLSHYEAYLIRQATGKAIRLTPLQPTNEHIHPFIVPKQGCSVRVYPWNIHLLAETIRRHEGKQVEIRHDTLYVNGQKAFSYLFHQDYYWMVSNNSANINDSRRFGFVPASHLIGRARLVWFSKDPTEDWLHGYRWQRFFHIIK